MSRGHKRTAVMRYSLAITVCLAAMAGWKAVQTDSAWLQPPVDTSSTDISISESTLFSKEKLLDGVTHIENDLSFMRGCEIKTISYTEHHYFKQTSSSQKNIPGTQAAFTVEYSCPELNSQTMTLSPTGSITYNLQYRPSDSTDGTGWETLSHGNG